MAPRLTMLLVMLVVAAAAGMNLVDGRSGASEPQVLLRDAKGALAVDVSRAGRAIVESENMRPGDLVRGRVTVTNAGSGRARMTLTSELMHATKTPEGDTFAEVLRLRVRRRTPHNERSGPKTLYEGTLGGMPALDLRTWHPEGEHQFTFLVSWPDDGGPDESSNAWQDSSAEVSFTWTAAPPGS